MKPDVRATMIRIQQQVVGHYRQLLRRSMKDLDRSAIQQKLDSAEALLAELVGHEQNTSQNRVKAA